MYVTIMIYFFIFNLSMWCFFIFTLMVHFGILTIGSFGVK